MTSSSSRLPMWEYMLTVSLALFLTACGGGGGGGNDTVLTFVDDWGQPLPDATAQITGGSLPAPILLDPDANGRVRVSLDPGDYTVTASFTLPGTSTQATRETTLTVGAGAAPVRTIEVKDLPALASAWASFRAGNYVDAATQFEAAVGSGVPTASTGLGWARVRNGELSAGDAAFNVDLDPSDATQDTYVGKAGLMLLRNSSSGDLAEAVTRLTTVINAPGEYSSAPAHDEIVEVDLLVCLALAHFLQGDVVNTQANLDLARPGIAGGSNAGIDLFNTLDLFLKN